MSPTPKLTRASKWQTDLLNTLHAKSPHPSHAQRLKISEETGLDETWVKHWFQKQSTSSAKTSLPAGQYPPSIGRNAVGRFPSAPTVTSPGTTVQPGDFYVHDPPLGWEVPAASSSEDTSDFVSYYDTQDRGPSSQSFQFHTFPIPFETLHANQPSKSQPHAQAPVQTYSMSKRTHVFSEPLQSQHYPNQAQVPQKSRALSPSLGYIPSAFPVSIFTDSPPKQQQNITSRHPPDNDQSASVQFSTLALQDPYSIRFPLTYSPRRRRSPNLSVFTPHQQPQPQSQTTYDINYGYDIPSEFSSPASLQSQSTSARYPAQKQLPYQMPIAYTARLADLTVFALNSRTPKNLADAGDSDEDKRNGTPHPNPSSDADLSNSDDMDENAVDEISSIANKGRLAKPSRARSCTKLTVEVDKENEQPIDDHEKATRAEDPLTESIDLKRAATEDDIKNKHRLSGYDRNGRAPRRVLRSASAQARLVELGS